MSSVNLVIDGKKIQAESGQTVLQAAEQAGIHIPVLCHHPALPPEGACRICVVEIEKQRTLQPACTFPVSEGLVVHTQSPKDPIMSDADTNRTRHCLEQADFIVLQEIFPTETSPYADVLLPGVTFAEKNGTFTNTERRVQMVRKAVEPPGEARQDWEIIAEVAKRIMSGQPTVIPEQKIDWDAPWAKWDYASPADIMREINALAPSYAGITYERLDKGETLQWPCPSSDHPGTPILHTKGFARGKGKFAPIDYIPPAERPDDDYPMILSTGRVLYHWHGGEMSRRASGLLEIYSQAQVEINPADAEKLGINGKKRVRVTSRRGSIESEAWVTERVPPGMVYANFHFPEASANELTHASLDPISKIPAYKVTAVKVELA